MSYGILHGGRGNLTRPGRFQNLYASTLHQEDLDAAEGESRGLSSKFDFLQRSNQIIVRFTCTRISYFALENDKPIIFLMNPPYATTNDMKGGSKECGESYIRPGFMGNLKGAKMNLFAQFLYRVIMIKEIQSYKR